MPRAARRASPARRRSSRAPPGAPTSRSAARAPIYAPSLQLAIVHHTAGSNTYTRAQSAAIVRAIEIYHVKGNGWNDIGYNFLVDKYGQVFEGRYGGIDRNVVGAHAEGFNTGSVGIALLGNYDSAAPTPAALAAVATADRVAARRRARRPAVDARRTSRAATRGSRPACPSSCAPSRATATRASPTARARSSTRSSPRSPRRRRRPGCRRSTRRRVQGNVGGPVRFPARLSLAAAVDGHRARPARRRRVDAGSGSGLGDRLDVGRDRRCRRAATRTRSTPAGARPATGVVGGGATTAAPALARPRTRRRGADAERRRPRRLADRALDARRAGAGDARRCSTSRRATVATLLDRVPAGGQLHAHLARLGAAGRPLHGSASTRRGDRRRRRRRRRRRCSSTARCRRSRPRRTTSRRTATGSSTRSRSRSGSRAGARAACASCAGRPSSGTVFEGDLQPGPAAARLARHARRRQLAGRAVPGARLARPTRSRRSRQGATFAIDTTPPVLQIVSGPKLRFRLSEQAVVRLVVDGKRIVKVEKAGAVPRAARRAWRRGDGGRHRPGGQPERRRSATRSRAFQAS